MLTYEKALELDKEIDDALGGGTGLSRQEGAWRAVKIVREAIERWEHLLDELNKDATQRKGDREGALERFEEGHVLTRVVYKGAYAYGVVKHHKDEEQILRSLLFQDKWRKGRRG